MKNQFFAKNDSEIVQPNIALSFSGIDFMTKIYNGELPLANIAKVLNFRLSKVEKGSISFEGSPTKEHFNISGNIHGSWYGALLDSAMACSILTTLAKGLTTTTLEYKINIIRPLKLGTSIKATGLVKHSGKSTGVATGSIVGKDDGKLYATGSTTCLILEL